MTNLLLKTFCNARVREEVSFVTLLRKAVEPLCALLRAVLAHIVGHGGYALEDGFALSRIGELDAILLLKHHDEFERIDRVETKTCAKERRIGFDLVSSHVFQIEHVNDMLLEFFDEIFHFYYIMYCYFILKVECARILLYSQLLVADCAAVRLTPLGVKLGSQVCGRTLFDACLVFSYAARRTGHAVGVRIGPRRF